MQIIVAWMLAHPVMAWSAMGVAAVVVLLALVFVLYMLVLYILGWVLSGRVKDRSGAKLNGDAFSVTPDDTTDEIVFRWIIANNGKFAARQLRTGMNIRPILRNGLAVSWRLSRDWDVLEAGNHVEIVIRIARDELSRLAGEFEDGSVVLWSYYSSARPKKPVKFAGMAGPRLRFRLAVGQVHGRDCLTVTDFTSIDFFRHPRRAADLY